jgi:hypothetical protein
MKRDNDQSFETGTYLAGGIVGLLAGLIAAYLYKRSAEQNRAEGSLPAKLELSDIFPIGLALVALIRQISDLAARPPDPSKK